MNIVVTGGAGFIGSNFVAFLQNRFPDYKIVCIDCITYAGSLETLNHIGAFKHQEDGLFKLYIDNICDRDRIFNIFKTEKPDIVINIAAESHVTRSLTNPELTFKTNVFGTQTLLDACVKYDVPIFHQVSTDEVYGSNSWLSLETGGFTEESLLNPSTPYSASKASADLLVKAYTRTYNIHTTITRCSNNYGRYQHVEKLIPLTINNIIKGHKIEIHGNGKHMRDWIHVDDHCNAIWQAVQNGEAGEIYNISSGVEKTTFDIVKIICDRLNVNSSDYITYVDDRLGNDTRYKMDCTKANRDIAWQATKKFEDELINTIDWYINNKDWWSKLRY